MDRHKSIRNRVRLARADVSEPEEHSWAMANDNQRKILVVEDDDRLANLLKRQLRAVGYEAETAARGATALSAVETQRPDLVILDLRLPDLSGYELCWMLRQLYDQAQLPIIVLTGVQKGLEELRREAVGANAYLYKPYDARELMKTIHRLLT